MKTSLFNFTVHQEDENDLGSEVEQIEPDAKRMRLMTEDGTPVDESHIIHEVTGMEVCIRLLFYSMDTI